MRIVVLTTLLFATAAPAAQEGQTIPADANLVVYRAYAEPRAWAPTVKVDDKKIAALGQHQYTAVHLLPGHHRLGLTWPFLSGQVGDDGVVTIEEGKTIYIELTGTSRLVGASLNTMTFRLGSGLELRNETAIAAIAKCCKFKPPKP